MLRMPSDARNFSLNFVPLVDDFFSQVAYLTKTCGNGLFMDKVAPGVPK